MVSGKDFTYNIADLGTTTNLSGDHLMFAGFGIMDEKYNDYQYAQVRNEVVMFLEGEPSKDGKYIISGTNQPGKWSKDLKAKIEVAVQKGARAVFILVDSTRFAYRTKEQLATNIIYKDVLKQNYPIPVIRINKNALAQMLLPREYKRINKYISNAQKQLHTGIPRIRLQQSKLPNCVLVFRVGLEIFPGAALARGPGDEAHALGAHGAEDLLEALALLFGFDLSRHTQMLNCRHINEISARQCYVRSDACTLFSDRLFCDLHKDLLAFAKQI